MSKSNQPRDFDAVKSAKTAPTPIDGIVLGGILGAKTRLLSPDIKVQRTALTEAINYGEPGLELVIQALQAESQQLQRAAYWLLKKRE